MPQLFQLIFQFIEGLSGRQYASLYPRQFEPTMAIRKHRLYIAEQLMELVHPHID
jgi:hypothetical protein